MSDYLPFVVVGITTGSIYALAGVGLVLTFKTSGIFNFAHGAQAALAAYVMFELRDRNGWPWPVAALGALVLVGLLGGLALAWIAQQLAAASAAARVAATVGLLVGIQGGLVAVFGAAAIPFDPFLPVESFGIAGVNVRYEQLIVALLTLALVVALHRFFRSARLGVSMHAVVDDPVLFSLHGSTPAHARRWAWVIGSSFASISGMLLAPTVGLDAGILTLLVFFAFGAAAVGAFAHIVRTYVGGIGIGVAAALLTKETDATSPFGALPGVLPFLVLFACLVFFKRGSFVESGARVIRRVAPPRVFSRRVNLAAGGFGGVALCLVPVVVGTIRLPVYTSALTYVVLFASLSLLMRTSGQISLCHVTFAGIGAVAYGHAAGETWWIVAVLLAGLAAVPVGAVVALPAVRLSGVHLAIATFGFGVLVQRLFYETSFAFGPTLQVPAPRPGFASTDTHYYFAVLAVVVLMCLIIVGIRRTQLGRMLRALADSPIALEAHGASTTITKLWVFCVSAFLAGVSGALIGPITGTASALEFDFTISFLLVAVLFLAGNQPIIGPAIAAALYVVMPSYLRSEAALEWQPILFGAATLVATMLAGRHVLDSIRRAMVTSRRTADRARRAAARPTSPAAAEAGV